MLRAALIFWSIIGILFSRYFYRHLAAWQLYKRDWNDLLSKPQPIPVTAVTAIGDEYLNPTAHQLGPEPVDIWRSLGGLQGIWRMRRNARILIALAAYAKRWNFTESVIVKERMRQVRQARSARQRVPCKACRAAGKRPAWGRPRLQNDEPVRAAVGRIARDSI